MTQRTHKRKTHSAPDRCVRCGQALKPARTLVPLIGVVGPECESHALAALERLSSYGLRDFFPAGELRLRAEPNPDGTYRAPARFYELHDLGRQYGPVRVGLRLEARGEERVWVLSLNSSDLLAYVRRHRAVTA